MSTQTTDTVLLVRPANFGYNNVTALSNTFQSKTDDSCSTVKENALAEFDGFVDKLISKGIHVIVTGDTPFPQKPDAVFPNNWISFHPDGTVILYPMAAVNRRTERSNAITDNLKHSFEISQIIDLSGYEKEDRFLEGTGSIVFDHINKIAYASLSPRTDKDIFLEVCNLLKYHPVYFHSYDKNKIEIYHTNVMMSVGSAFVIICLDSICNEKEKAAVTKSLTKTGHQIIDITVEQMQLYAGNMLALKNNRNEELLTMSESAFNSLTLHQKKELEKYCELISLPVRTIETIGGGSARCMIAEIFLKPKNNSI